METDEGAASYMESYGEGKNTPLRLKIASYLKPGEWVLDVGCGPGWNFDTFLESGPSVIYRGLDYSERFVRVANQRTGTKAFRLGDVRKIDEPGSSYDVVILQDVLEHTNGYEEPLKQALRVARRLVIVTFWRMGDTDKTNDDGDDGWGSVYDKVKWEKFLDTSNWRHEQIESNNRTRDIYIIEVNHGNGA